MTTFTGPIKSKGLDTDARTGEVQLIQRATVGAINSAGNPVTFSLPNPSDVLDFVVTVETPFAAGALVTAANVQFSAAGDATLGIVVASASGTYRLSTTVGGNAAQLRGVATTVEAFVSTQSLASALTVGQAMLTVVYVDRTSAAGL